MIAVLTNISFRNTGGPKPIFFNIYGNRLIGASLGVSPEKSPEIPDVQLVDLQLINLRHLGHESINKDYHPNLFYL